MIFTGFLRANMGAARVGFMSCLGQRNFGADLCTSDYIWDLEKREDWDKKVIGAADPMILAFSATWCGPCKMVKPVLRAAVTSFEGKVGLVTVDIDRFSKIAESLSVTHVPSIFTVKDKEVVSKYEGSTQNAEELKAYIKLAIVNSKE
jgi:thioredoxin 1